MLLLDIIFCSNFLGVGSIFVFLELKMEARVREEFDLRRKLCGLLSSLVLAAEAEVRFERAPASREVDLGCLTPVSFPR